ncbi:hypothetical protein Tco_0719282, partial [Tanacetum coccineum]
LEDADGISSLPNSKIFKQLALMRYASDSDKLTFQKGQFSPQWKFLIHTILHFLSAKKTGPIQHGKGSTVSVESHHIPITTPSTSQPPLSSPSRVPTPPHDSPLPGGHTPGSDEGRFFQTRRIIAEIDQNLSISLVQDEGTSWIQEDAKIQGRTSADTEGEKQISTANIAVPTAGVSIAEAELSIVIPEVSTAAKNLVYIRRSAEKRKDKGKAIMKEDESIQKNTNKQLEQERLERLGYEEAIRLQEQVNEEERQRIARDAEIAKQLQEEIDTARQEQEKYDLEKALDLQKSFSKAEDQIHSFVPMDSKLEVHKLIRAGQEALEESAKRQKIGEASGSGEEQSEEKEKEVSEEELKKLLVIAPIDEVYIEALQIFEDMLRRFNRDDLEKLWDLVKKRFSSTEPTVDKEKELWVKLKRVKVSTASTNLTLLKKINTADKV